MEAIRPELAASFAGSLYLQGGGTLLLELSSLTATVDAKVSWFLPSRSCFTTVPADGSDGELDAARGGLSSATTVPRAREASLRKPCRPSVEGLLRDGKTSLRGTSEERKGDATAEERATSWLRWATTTFRRSSQVSSGHACGRRDRAARSSSSSNRHR